MQDINNLECKRSCVQFMKFNLNFVSKLNQFTCNKMFFSDKC